MGFFFLPPLNRSYCVLRVPQEVQVISIQHKCMCFAKVPKIMKYVTLDHKKNVISSNSHTLYGSKLLIFILYQKSLGY